MSLLYFAVLCTSQPSFLIFLPRLSAFCIDMKFQKLRELKPIILSVVDNFPCYLHSKCIFLYFCSKILSNYIASAKYGYCLR
jgi:hypothetical protein